MIYIYVNKTLSFIKKINLALFFAIAIFVDNSRHTKVMIMIITFHLFNCLDLGLQG